MCAEIECYQIIQNIPQWIGIEKGRDPLGNLGDVFSEDIHGWNSYFSVYCPQNCDTRLLDDIKARKENTYKKLCNIFNQWKGEKSSNFDIWFEEEWRSFGSTIIKCYLEDKERKQYKFDRLLDENTFEINDIMSSSTAERIIETIKSEFKHYDIKAEVIGNKITEYLNSRAMGKLPFNRIRAALWACLAHNAISGQKEIGTKGINNDISFISHLLPYCDAIFVDNTCHHLLNMLRDKKILEYKCKIFSKKLNKNEFLDFLNNIISTTPKAHYEKLDEVYGASWRNE